MIVDILSEIQSRSISIDEAYKKVNSIKEEVHFSKTNVYAEYFVDKNKVDLARIIGMDEYEYTAYCQSADLETLANWRYTGWPTKCCLTGKSLDYKKYGWFVTELTDGTIGLKLIND